MLPCSRSLLTWIIGTLFLCVFSKRPGKVYGKYTKGAICYNCPHIHARTSRCETTRVCRADEACMMTIGLIRWRENISETVQQSCIKTKKCEVWSTESPCVRATKETSGELTSGMYSSFYTYLAMANHFDRHDVALGGFNKYMLTSAFLGKMRTMTGINRKMNSLGLPLNFDTVPAPVETHWATPKRALEAALATELREGDKIRRTITASKGCGEITTFADFLETKVLGDNYKVIKELAELIVSISTMQCRTTPGIVDYLVDKQIEYGQYFFPVYALGVISRYGNESTELNTDDLTIWDRIVPNLFTPLVFG
ncbi:unnamed protein product [Owenia fusiformis]|uniref:ferroxidase n=1 Tax=Owenia fusiformis TaxID=6347 RepID=A0A8J1U491_OWEFU|nr:unnamed protein product [Owenia fusiformis]